MGQIKIIITEDEHHWVLEERKKIMGKVKAKVKVQLECIAEVWLEENEVSSELTLDEVIDIVDINDVGDFDVIDFL